MAYRKQRANYFSPIQVFRLPQIKACEACTHLNRRYCQLKKMKIFQPDRSRCDFFNWPPRTDDPETREATRWEDDPETREAKRIEKEPYNP